MKCDETYGCGREVPAGFSFAKKDWDSPDADEEGFVLVKVCRDCSTTMEDDE